MSSEAAVAAVGRTLVALLRQHMADPPHSITLAPPDVPVKNQAGDRRLNLFLYRVEENGHLRNLDRVAPGGTYGRPPLSLDLHYLATAYGPRQDDDETPHRILGDAMGVLHDHALLHPRNEAHANVLAAGLHDAVESITISLESIDLDELSKVWTALTAPFRLSASYRITVVQIDSSRPRRHAPRVGESRDSVRVGVHPMRLPSLTALHVQRREEEPADGTLWPLRIAFAAVGDRVVVEGTGLGEEDDGTRLFVGGHEVAAPFDEHRPDRIVAALPDVLALRPGTHLVRVLGGVPASSSNRVPVVVVPRVDAAVVDASGDRITLHGSHLLDPTQDSLTILGSPDRGPEHGAVVPSWRYTAAAPDRIEFPRPDGLAPGTHPVRVRVGTAESLLRDDTRVVLP